MSVPTTSARLPGTVLASLQAPPESRFPLQNSPDRPAGKGWKSMRPARRFLPTAGYGILPVENRPNRDPAGPSMLVRDAVGNWPLCLPIYDGFITGWRAAVQAGKIPFPLSRRFLGNPAPSIALPVSEIKQTHFPASGGQPRRERRQPDMLSHGEQKPGNPAKSGVSDNRGYGSAWGAARQSGG